MKNLQKSNPEKWYLSKIDDITIDKLQLKKFTANVLAIRSNNNLKNCNEESIFEAVFKATNYDLPLDPFFGYAWIVPYAKKQKLPNGEWITKFVAQFQIGWKGWVQLAHRTGLYKTINALVVKNGELISQNLLDDEFEFAWINDPIERESKETIGYVAKFKMLSGFEKTIYWTKSQMQNHFLKWSESYKKEKRFITADFDSMALKTILTQLLRKWGYMSVEMQQAYQSDQAVIIDGNIDYIDNPNNKYNENEITNKNINDFEQQILDELKR